MDIFTLTQQEAARSVYSAMAALIAVLILICACNLPKGPPPTGSAPQAVSRPAPNDRLPQLTYLSLRSANTARQQEWDPGSQLTLTYRANELAGEVGEACNVAKKLERERLGIAGSRDTVEHLAQELADVVICADLLAMSEGIDLDEAVRTKFNATSEKVGLATRIAEPEIHWLGDEGGGA